MNSEVDLSVMYTKMSLLTVYVLFCATHVPSGLSQLVYNMDTCTNVTFHRRSEMDDLVFTGGLVEEMNQVDMRAECFSECQWRKLCNLVLYNPLTRKCRLHSEISDSSSDGSSESGWQYYGGVENTKAAAATKAALDKPYLHCSSQIHYQKLWSGHYAKKVGHPVSCDGYRLANARPDVEIINAAVEDVCQHPFNVVAANRTASCLRDGSWESVRIKCTACYTGMSVPSLDSATIRTEVLPFDLTAGMTFRISVAGDLTTWSRVRFELPNNDRVLSLSLRWNYSPPSLVFTTLQGGVFGKVDAENIDVDNINNYDLDIEITNSSFKISVDGIFKNECQMRLPLTGVRRVALLGYTAIHSVQLFC